MTAAKKFVPLYIVDVFSIGKKKYTGNQLAVIRNSGSLTSDVMQRIANEMHFSETTFIDSDKKSSNGGYDVRIFTPNNELKFAGHPTLGTAFLIQQQIIGKQVESVKLNLGVGQITVSFSYKNGSVSGGWMKQIDPIFQNGDHSTSELASFLELTRRTLILDFRSKMSLLASSLQ